MRLLFVLLLIHFTSVAQRTVLVIGNHSKVCLDGIHQLEISDSLPEHLEKYGAIMLFSSSTSKLNRNDINRIIVFVEMGGGLYAGSENWPLQSESNQITNQLYSKECFGRYDPITIEIAEEGGNLNLKDSRAIPSGISTVAFPMDYRLKVEAWVEDQPLILSGEHLKGRVIIDGGYSRFYCEQRNKDSDDLLQKFLVFLLQD